MVGQPGGDAASPALQAWDTVRRVREPVAWLLLLIAGLVVLVSAWQLFGLPGAPVPAASGPVASTTITPVPSASGFASSVISSSPFTSTSQTPVTTFGVRASAVAPQFAGGGIFLLPLVSVFLVAFAGGLVGRARQVVQTAIAIQVVTLGLGLVSLLGAANAHLRHGVWFVFDVIDLAAVATALMLTVAVIRSQALRTLTPQLADFEADDEDFDEEESDPGADEVDF